jgi:hypothetical protein
MVMTESKIFEVADGVEITKALLKVNTAIE